MRSERVAVFIPFPPLYHATVSDTDTVGYFFWILLRICGLIMLLEPVDSGMGSFPGDYRKAFVISVGLRNGGPPGPVLNKSFCTLG